MVRLLFSPRYFITQKVTYQYSRFAARGLIFSLARQGVFDCEHPLLQFTIGYSFRLFCLSAIDS